MKNPLRLMSCLLLVALVVSGLWVAKAVNFSTQEDVIEATPATLAAGLSLQDMSVQSELILTGTCLDTRSQWIDRSLVTLATVSITETIKGAELSTVTVVLPGGVDANGRIPVAMTYPGAPQIAPGEDVFLFLTREEGIADGYTVAGFAQGKYSIVKDQQGAQLVSRDLTKMNLQSGTGIVRGNRNLVPLSEFKAKVRGHLGQ